MQIDETIQYKHNFPLKNVIEPFEFIQHDQTDIDNDSNTTQLKAHSLYVAPPSISHLGLHASETSANDSNNVIETIDYDWDEDPQQITIRSCKIPTEFEPNEGHFGKEILTLETVPLTYKQATSADHKFTWQSTIESDELQSMIKHNVWTLVPYNRTKKAVLVKWIFGVKADGRKRARLVAIGCRDPEQYSPNDKTSPTPSADTIRWLFAHTSYTKIKLIQLDVKTAFLHGKIDREKYIIVPPGRVDRKKFICKLNKALYRLATAPKCY